MKIFQNQSDKSCSIIPMTFILILLHQCILNLDDYKCILQLDLFFIYKILALTDG